MLSLFASLVVGESHGVPFCFRQRRPGPNNSDGVANEETVSLLYHLAMKGKTVRDMDDAFNEVGYVVLYWRDIVTIIL